MPIPVNIITGVLGVGKTTVIRHLISQRPPNENWAIVVNEFGALGIDGAVLDTAGGLTSDGGGDGGVTVREVAGGCLCCAVAAPFTVAVTQVLRRAKPDRLIIEPSGMGHPGGLFDALSGEYLSKTLELRATVALVDMSEVARRGELFHSEAFRDQVHCADVVVGAKADVASEADVEAFRAWAADELYPAKSHVTTIANGALPIGVLDVACGPTAPPLPTGHRLAQSAAAAAGTAAAVGSGGPLGPAPVPTAVAPGEPHRVLGGTAEFKTVGWVFSREDVFVRPRLTALFASLAAAPGVKRFKGVMRVGAEWVMPVVETGGGGSGAVERRVKLETIAYRRDSRLEIIVMSSPHAGDEGGGGGSGGGKGGEEEEEEEEEKRVHRGYTMDRQSEEEEEEKLHVERAGRAAAACDWDALEAAIKAAIKPPRAVKS